MISPPDAVDSWIDALVGPHFGLIEDLQRAVPEPDDIPLSVFAARLAHTSLLGALDAPRLASGAAIDPQQACAACIGEAVERYAAAWILPGRVTCATAKALNGEVILPDQFALFRSSQYRRFASRFPFRRWRPRDPLGWTQARSLVDDRQVWVPSVFVFQPYIPARNEPLIAPCLSTGLACATNRVDAEIAGLCEVVERDAVSLAWLGSVQPPILDVANDTLDHQTAQAVASLVSILNQRGFRWKLLDLTTDIGFPVAVAIIEGHSPVGWIVAFGSACHPVPSVACLKALVEAGHCRMYVKGLIREQPTAKSGWRFQHVTSFEQHARFYTSYPEHRGALNYFFGGKRKSRWTLSDHTQKLDSTWLCQQAARLAKAGYEPLAVDLTPPDVSPLGFYVTRVIVPGLQPLHGNHDWRHLGGQRLREVPRVFGASAKQPWRYNRYPHPCP